MGFLSVSIGHFSIWPVLCCLEPICRTNSGRRQFPLLSISRTGFPTLVSVGILLLMRCGLESSHLCPIFVFSVVLLTLTFPKNVARNTVTEKSTVVLSTHILSDTTNQTLSTKFG